MALIKNKPLKDALIYFLSGFLTLLLIEIGFRIKVYAEDTKTLDQLAEYSREPQPGKDAPLGDLIRLNPNPKIIYEFKPNLNTKFKNATININEHGFRGKPVPREKPAGTVRILGLGDSVMFGWGVNDGEEFTALLENKLQANFPECQWQIVNTAVPGYTTWMEVATLEEKGLAYQPDVVIINFVLNDLQLPHFIRNQINYYSITTCFAYEYLKNKLNPPSDGLSDMDTKPTPTELYQRKAPKKFSVLEGEAAYSAAMERLKMLSTTHGFDVIVLAYNKNKVPEIVKNNCKKLGFPIVKFGESWNEYAAANNITDLKYAWRLSKTDRHPSVIGHQFLAKILFDYLAENSKNKLCPTSSAPVE